MRALLLRQNENQTSAQIETVAEEALPDGNVTVDIACSGINYKDALAITGKGKIIRQFPMIPGIDFAGSVYRSDDPRFVPGQLVLLTGFGVGEKHWGGLAERAAVNGDWLVPVPEGLDARKAMIIGTAGFTAMLCVMALEKGGVTPQSGEVIVTGASGGVGSTAVALLNALGWRVVAVSGRQDNEHYLREIGASDVLPRSQFVSQGKPLEKQRWAAAIDTVGGQVLANVLAQMHYNGVVAACGLAGGTSLPTTVMPFILRNVRLQGVDSVMLPTEQRQQVWQRLADLLPASFYQQVCHEVTLCGAITAAEQLLNNQITGRTLVNIR